MLLPQKDISSLVELQFHFLIFFYGATIFCFFVLHILYGHTPQDMHKENMAA